MCSKQSAHTCTSVSKYSCSFYFHSNLLLHCPFPKSVRRMPWVKLTVSQAAVGVAATVVFTIIAAVELFTSKQNLICITETRLCWALNIIQDTEDRNRIGHLEQPEWERRSSFLVLICFKGCSDFANCSKTAPICYFPQTVF